MKVSKIISRISVIAIICIIIFASLSNVIVRANENPENGIVEDIKTIGDYNNDEDEENYGRTVSHSGKDGGVSWSLYEDGYLEVTVTGDLSNVPGYSGEGFYGWPWDDYRDSIIHVKVSGNGLTKADYMFDLCDDMTDIDISGFNTSNVTSMNFMFDSCEKLQKVDLSNFDTHNVVSADGLFWGCKALISLNCNSFDTRKMSNMGDMFRDCTLLTSIDMSSFDLSGASDVYNMIAGCNSLSMIKTPKRLSHQYDVVINLPRVFINTNGERRTQITDTNDVYTLNGVAMYRLYNPNSGEHFYTGNQDEVNNIVSYGWRDEGIAWVAPTVSNTPVYRLYNPNAGDHHYTMYENERNSLVKVGWKYEGIGWYSAPDNGVVLYRLYNPNAKAGSHHYTTDASERDNLVSVGWKYEGTAWYGMK